MAASSTTAASDQRPQQGRGPRHHPGIGEGLPGSHARVRRKEHVAAVVRPPDRTDIRTKLSHATDAEASTRERERQQAQNGKAPDKSDQARSRLTLAAAHAKKQTPVGISTRVTP